MTYEALQRTDFSAGEQPEHLTDQRANLEAWLRYQRHEFLRKLRDLSREQLVAWSIPPMELSVLGLVRHMTQMEHGYVIWGIGGGVLTEPYGETDFAGATVEQVDSDLTRYFEAVEQADATIAAVASGDTPGAGHGRPLNAVLLKMVHEYTLHAGQAHMLRFASLGKMKR
ncbi:MAG: DUF664 domain-containing protein [Actinomycetota bacterium]